MPFNPREVAQLTVSGRNFNQWESVWAQERWGESFSYFRFTSTEFPSGAAPNAGWSGILVAPCDKCVLTFGGEPAMTGYVMQRQVAYDADRHQIMLIGKSASFWGYKSSIDAKHTNMDGMGIIDMANFLLGPFDIGVKPFGDPDNSPFEKPNRGSPGENIWAFLDKKAREKHVTLSSDAFGNAVLIGKHVTPATDVLEEGVNIKKMQVTFSIEDTWQQIDVLGQTAGGDQQSGPDAQEQEGHAIGKGCINCKLVIPLEDPVKDTSVLQVRAEYEAHWTDTTNIVANITVQGWFAPSGHLWHAGQTVMVKSQMAPLNQVMKIKTVTWQQDNENGTETVLECVWPKLGLNDFGIDVGDPVDPLNAANKAASQLPDSPIPLP